MSSISNVTVCLQEVVGMAKNNENTNCNDVRFLISNFISWNRYKAAYNNVMRTTLSLDFGWHIALTVLRRATNSQTKHMSIPVHVGLIKSCRTKRNNCTDLNEGTGTYTLRKPISFTEFSLLRRMQSYADLWLTLMANTRHCVVSFSILPVPGLW